MTEQELEEYRKQARERTPVKYRQPISAFTSRDVEGSEENVDYVPGTHLRIWYNNLIEGYEMHHHAAVEIIVCVENGYDVLAEDTVFHLTPGDIIFLPPNMLHRLPGGEGTRFICLVDPAPFQAFRDFKILGPIMMHPLLLQKSSGSSLYREVYALMNEAIETYFSSGSMWELSTYASLFKVWSRIGQDFYGGKESFAGPAEGPHNANYEKFADLLDYLDSHYGEDITLEQAADRVGFSKFHFTRLFKEYTGTTFLDYLMHKRIQEAQKLLVTKLSITDITYATGFNNLTSFNRSFRKYTGLSPTQYRAMSESFNGHISTSVIGIRETPADAAL